jgi:hypothetical protein
MSRAAQDFGVEQAEIKRLKAENSRLREDVEILRAATTPRRRARLPQPLNMAFVEDMRAVSHAVESTSRVREQGCPVAARTYLVCRAGGRHRPHRL